MHLAHVRMVGHALMVLGPIHVAVLLVTKAISVISVRLCFSLYCLSHESSSNQQFISYMYMFTVFLLLQISTSVHLTHVLMVGHAMMVLGPIHVAALLVTKAISVTSVRLDFSLYFSPMIRLLTTNSYHTCTCLLCFSERDECASNP